MAHGRPNDGEDREIFLAAVAGTQPLADRDRAPAPRRPRRARPGAPTPGLIVERHGDRVSARAPGVSRRQVSALGAARMAPDATIDLHGMRADEARRALTRALEAAAAAGHQLLLVVHGKGLHSERQPVLREAVIAWLSGALSHRVHALTTAADRDGGTGALYVRLRRS